MPFCFFGLGELFVASDGSGLVEQVGGRGLSLKVSAESLQKLSGMPLWNPVVPDDRFFQPGKEWSGGRQPEAQEQAA